MLRIRNNRIPRIATMQQWHGTMIGSVLTEEMGRRSRGKRTNLRKNIRPARGINCRAKNGCLKN